MMMVNFCGSNWLRQGARLLISILHFLVLQAALRYQFGDAKLRSFFSHLTNRSCKFTLSIVSRKLLFNLINIFLIHHLIF